MKAKKSFLTKNLLSSLAEFIKTSGQTMIDLQKWQSAYLVGGGEYVRIIKKDYRQRLVKRALYDLKNRKFITTQKIGQRLLVSLTNKGQLAMMAKELTTAPKLKNGWQTMLIFDIPETARRSRQVLRHWLREADFFMVQKSVWLSNKDVARILKKVLQQLKLRQWINVYLVKNTN